MVDGFNTSKPDITKKQTKSYDKIMPYNIHQKFANGTVDKTSKPFRDDSCVLAVQQGNNYFFLHTYKECIVFTAITISKR